MLHTLPKPEQKIRDHRRTDQIADIMNVRQSDPSVF